VSASLPQNEGQSLGVAQGPAKGQSLFCWVRRGLETPGRRAKRLKEEGEILRCAQNDREKEAERLKVEQVKRARHDAWLKCHVALCSEIAAPGYPKKKDLERWFSRLAGTNVLGYAMLQDLKEMVYSGLHFEEARAILRLAVSTNAVALSVWDEEAVREQAEAEAKGEVERGNGKVAERTEAEGKE